MKYQDKLDIVMLIETATYGLCGEKHIDSETFLKILTNPKVTNRIFALADVKHNGYIKVEELVRFLAALSKPRLKKELSHEQAKTLEELFKQSLPANQTELTMQEFKKLMPSKNTFFVERVLKSFDKSGNGKVSLQEFLDTMQEFALTETNSEKVRFLFKVYDVNDDGKLQREELERVMAECLRESGLQLPEIDVKALAFALYDDALGDDVDTGGINFEQLRRALDKHEGLLENLTVTLSKWMVPEQQQHREGWFRKASNGMSKFCTGVYFQNKKRLLFFFTLYFLLNIAIFGIPAYSLRGIMNLNGSHPNWFYIMARGNGRVLNFNSSLILLLVLRYVITKLRELGLGFVLPLDENIYIHKVIGVVIFIQSLVHTVMHIFNFCELLFFKCSLKIVPTFDTI